MEWVLGDRKVAKAWLEVESWSFRTVSLIILFGRISRPIEDLDKAVYKKLTQKRPKKTRSLIGIRKGIDEGITLEEMPGEDNKYQELQDSNIKKVMI